jgi:hypothetical protein
VLIWSWLFASANLAAFWIRIVRQAKPFLHFYAGFVAEKID